MTDDSTRSVIEHYRSEQRKADVRKIKQVVREGIENGTRALERADTSGQLKYWLYVLDLCIEELLPHLVEGPEFLWRLDPELREYEEFYYEPTSRALKDPDEYRKQLVRDLEAYPDVYKFASRYVGHSASSPMGAIKQLFSSCYTLAVYQGVIDGGRTVQIPVYGHGLQLGVQHEPWERDSPDKMHVVDPDGHPPVSVNQGLPGFGKSTAGFSQAEDRFADGRKVIDVVDLGDLESGLYDVPQGQTELRETREDLGLPPDFRDHPHYDRPDIEILVPLTPELSEKEVPVREDGSTVVQPYTVPAADLPRRALNMMLAHLTDVQQMYLDRAYQSVSRRRDWSLRDLADEVDKTDANDGVKKRIRSSLSSVQNLGLVRTRDCPHAINWGDIFEDTDTITVFTQSLVDGSSRRFMVLAYLVQALYHEREQRRGLPPLTAMFRELHQVAPNDRAARQDSRDREIQMAMVSAFQQLCSLHRHEGIEVLADTQQLEGQVSKRARAQVERVVTFRSQIGTLEPLFANFVGFDGDRQEYMRTIAREFDPGEAAVLGYSGTDRALEMPLQIAPPMCHVLDETSEYDDGWVARCEMLQQADDLPSEYLASAPWDSKLPEQLQFDDRDELLAGASADPEDPETLVEAFVEASLAEVDVDEAALRLDDVVSALRGFAAANGYDADDIPRRDQLGRDLSEIVELERDRRMIDGDRSTFYSGLRFTSEGQRHRDAEVEFGDDTGDVSTAD